MSEVINNNAQDGWIYSKTVKQHFFHPKNFLEKAPKKNEFNAEGQVGSPQWEML